MVVYNKAQIGWINTKNGFVRDAYIYDQLTTDLRPFIMKFKE